MAVNLALKYSSNVDEVIKLGALSNSAVNNDYDFVGVQTVKVYSFDTAPMHDYKAEGTSRYGTPEELQDNIQEMTMRMKRSFTFTIDKTYAVDTPEGVRNAGQALRRQIDRIIIPELDKYRFKEISKHAKHISTGTVTKTNAYQLFLEANEKIDEDEIPLTGRVAYVTPAYYNLLKLSPEFIKKGDLSQTMLVNGQIGEVDGVKIVKVVSSRLPEKCSFIIAHSMATVAPVKLEEYKIHTDPPGIAGNLVEGLLYYDAFILKNKKCAIAVHFTETVEPKPEEDETE